MDGRGMMEERFEQFLAELTGAIAKEYGASIYSLVV